MFQRLHRAVGSEKIFLPFPPFGLLGELAAAAQPVEEDRVVGRAVEEADVEIPQLLERLVEKSQLFVGVEYRHRRVQLVERLGMIAQHALVLGPNIFDLAQIDRDSGRPLGAGKISHAKLAAVAGDHRRHRLRENRFREMMARNPLANLRAEEFPRLA